MALVEGQSLVECNEPDNSVRLTGLNGPVLDPEN